MKIQDPKELSKLVSYIIMGDGGVYKTGKSEKSNCYFTMNMLKRHKDFIIFCKEVIENKVSCKIKDRYLSNSDGYNRKPQLNLLSKTHPYLTTMRSRIYTDRYKGICPHALKLLDFQALSILYMSDGSVDISTSGKVKTLTLNMKRLSYGDQFILKKALKEKLDLEWNINKQNQYYYLRLRNKDVMKFMEGISPYIFPSFEYKLLEDFRTVSSNEN